MDRMCSGCEQLFRWLVIAPISSLHYTNVIRLAQAECYDRIASCQVVSAGSNLRFTRLLPSESAYGDQWDSAFSKGERICIDDPSGEVEGRYQKWENMVRESWFWLQIMKGSDYRRHRLSTVASFNRDMHEGSAGQLDWIEWESSALLSRN